MIFGACGLLVQTVLLRGLLRWAAGGRARQAGGGGLGAPLLPSALPPLADAVGRESAIEEAAGGRPTSLPTLLLTFLSAPPAHPPPPPLACPRCSWLGEQRVLLVALCASTVQQLIIGLAGQKWVAFLGISLGSLGGWIHGWRRLAGLVWCVGAALRVHCQCGLPTPAANLLVWHAHAGAACTNCCRFAATSHKPQAA